MVEPLIRRRVATMGADSRYRTTDASVHTRCMSKESQDSRGAHNQQTVSLTRDRQHGIPSRSPPEQEAAGAELDEPWRRSSTGQVPMILDCLEYQDANIERRRSCLDCSSCFTRTQHERGITAQEAQGGVKKRRPAVV